MATELHALSERDRAWGCPKIARLAELARAGLPVPPGVVLPEPALEDAAAGLMELLARGPVIVRSAAPHEDRAESSFAGLGLSVPGCRNLAQVVAALAEIARHAGSGGGGSAPAVLVQHEVFRRSLVVGAWTEQDAYVEVHDRAGDVLGGGATPDYCGPPAAWPDPAGVAVASLGERVRALVGGPHGTEVELVVDPRGDVAVVQGRPLVEPLAPGWPAFREALALDLAARPTPPPLAGLLVLDAEHNPEPLSPAHAWLMEWLARERPAAGDPIVLAGWLYVRALPRDLATASGAPRRSARAALTRLVEEHLPRARLALAQMEERLPRVDRPGLAGAIDGGLVAFLAMIDVYLGELVPARAIDHVAAGDVEQPFTLRDRGAYLDVLPARWDLDSPVLGRWLAPAPERAAPLPEDEPTAATLLAEWDDHLFALGLAPLRAVYRRAAALMGIDEAFVFSITPDELRAWASGRGSETLDLAERARTRSAVRHAQAQLTPPLRLLDGHPLPALPGRGRGIPVGEPFEGPIAPRRDLADLLDRPPPAGAIVSLPALTAPAAVALARLGVHAVCTEHGGALGHGVLMARELRLSALIGCTGATKIPAGTIVRLDTRRGRLFAPATALR